MSRNGYKHAGRIASHPACDLNAGGVRCPTCGQLFDRIRQYTAHFLAHDPDEETAWRYLDWRTYRRHAQARGWADPEAMFDREEA